MRFLRKSLFQIHYTILVKPDGVTIPIIISYYKNKVYFIRHLNFFLLLYIQLTILVQSDGVTILIIISYYKNNACFIGLF